MRKLESLTKGVQVVGIDPAGPVTIVSTDAVGDDAVSVFYKVADGVSAERMLFREDEPKFAIVPATSTSRSMIATLAACPTQRRRYRAWGDAIRRDRRIC